MKAAFDLALPRPSLAWREPGPTLNSGLCPPLSPIPTLRLRFKRAAQRQGPGRRCSLAPCCPADSSLTARGNAPRERMLPMGLAARRPLQEPVWQFWTRGGSQTGLHLGVKRLGSARSPRCGPPPGPAGWLPSPPRAAPSSRHGPPPNHSQFSRHSGPGVLGFVTVLPSVHHTCYNSDTFSGALCARRWARLCSDKASAPSPEGDASPCLTKRPGDRHVGLENHHCSTNKKRCAHTCPHGRGVETLDTPMLA